MKTELIIRWDGDVPGIGAHRLSLSVWMRPLALLLKSIRRTATGMLGDALDTADHNLRGGRFARDAKLIDLEIAAIADGCVQVEFVVTGGAPDTQEGLFPRMPEDLPSQAVTRVLADIEAEASGRLANAAVRTYLHALPGGISSHDYELRQNGTRVCSARVQNAVLPETPADLPQLERISGRIVAVGFTPITVTLKSADQGARKRVFSATSTQLEDAIRLRDRDVVAMCVVADKPRLVWLRDVADLAPTPDKTQRLERFLTDWPETLEILSR